MYFLQKIFIPYFHLYFCFGIIMSGKVKIFTIFIAILEYCGGVIHIFHRVFHICKAVNFTLRLCKALCLYAVEIIP